jgi:ABC-type uncharacterized transport system substrate-binding protein
MPRLQPALLSILALAPEAATSPASAHPHAWITMRSDVVFDDAGRIAALDIAWTFDADYSAAAIEGLDKNGDGYYSAGELQPLAKENIEALKEYDYFVYVRSRGKKLAYGPVSEYGQIYNDGILKMHFTLPLAHPVDPHKEQVSYQIYDPTFYIAMDYEKAAPVSGLGKIPGDCKVVLKPAPSDSNTDTTRQWLAGKDQNWQPQPGEDFGSLFAQPVEVRCGKEAATQ